MLMLRHHSGKLLHMLHSQARIFMLMKNFAHKYMNFPFDYQNISQVELKIGELSGNEFLIKTFLIKFSLISREREIWELQTQFHYHTTENNFFVLFVSKFMLMSN